MIEHLENEVRDELEASRQGQKRAVAVMHVNGNRLEVLGRIGPSGGIRLGYSYCGVRMERKTLLTLVCSEQSCPCRAASLAKWQQHQCQLWRKRRLCGQGELCTGRHGPTGH